VPSIAAALPRPSRSQRLIAAGALLALVGSLSACGYGSKKDDNSSTPAAASSDQNSSAKKLSASQVRIGYFANITHATAVVGVQQGFFAKELGGTKLKQQVFNAGPDELEALNAGAIDIGWIGPSPAVNGFAKSKGQNLRIISGSASGGVLLVVNPKKIKSTDDLKGKRIATPQLGNTQDVALLNYLADKHLKVDPQTGKGDVKVIREDNKEIPTSFQRGDLDGAWVPEPTASKLVAAGGHTLLDERKLWDGGKFVVTNVIVSQKFLKAHPDVVEAVLRGSVKTNAWIEANPEDAKKSVNAALTKLSGAPLPGDVIDPAFKDMAVTNDPLASTLQEEAGHAVKAGLLDKPDLKGIYDLRPLNKVLKSEGEPPVDDAGLGVK
jgi:NitT/TauT family transport system substrate-binding protein